MSKICMRKQIDAYNILFKMCVRHTKCASRPFILFILAGSSQLLCRDKFSANGVPDILVKAR